MFSSSSTATAAHSTSTACDSRSPSIPRNHSSFQLTFTHGVIFGQLSLLVVVVIFIKYVIFEDPQKQHKTRRFVKPRRRRSESLSRGAAEPELLSKLSYDMSTHPPETADWLNVLIAQAFVAYRSLVHGIGHTSAQAKGEKAREMVEEAINFARSEIPGIIGVDYITVTQVNFGQEYPVCTNARVRPADETGRMRVEVDVDYSDHVSLSIETKVVVNFPTSRFAVMPMSLGLTLNQLSATVMAEIPPVAIPLPIHQDPSAPTPAILLSLDPDFTLSMVTTSLLGSRAKLQDMPKIEQLILSRLRGWIVDNLVWPQVRVLKLPGLGRKGSIEDVINGDGEYVLVEGTSTDLGTTKEAVREADDDQDSLSRPPPDFHSYQDDSHTPYQHTLQQIGTSTALPRQSPHRRSASGSSRLNISLPPSRSPLGVVTAPRLRLNARPDVKQASADPEELSNLTPSGLLPPANRGIVGSRHTATNGHCHRPPDWQPHENFAFRDAATSDDQARWARAGGMSGVSLGLGTQPNHRTQGTRERIKESGSISAKARVAHAPSER